MAWQRANATQSALAAAEQNFVDICDTEDEVDEDAVEQAYEAMQQACMDADAELNAVRRDTDDWASVVARTLR